MKQTSEGWVVGFTEKVGPRPSSDIFQINHLPLHPDDIPNAVDNTLVNFEVMTIATGTSEFDVMDMDVAKIV